MKIEEINKRIKELWQIIYRGRDIDQVELRAEAKVGFLWLAMKLLQAVLV